MSDLPIPKTKMSAKRKRELLIIGAAGIVLLFLYLRSRSSTGSSTNSTNAADTQAAVDNAVAQQQAQDAATYGYGAYGSAGSYGGGDTSAPVDLSGLTSGLSQVDTDLQNLPGQIAAQMPYYTSGPNPPEAPAAAPPPATSPVATAPIVVNVMGQPAKTAPAGGVRLSTGAGRGDINAPFGAKKPTAPKGYVAIGLGKGNWEFKPAAPKTGSTSHHQSKTKK